MSKLPTIETERLILRPFVLADAPDVQRLAGDRDVASTTLNIPHPYQDGVAEQWIGTHQERFDRGENVALAIVDRVQRLLIGCITLALAKEFDRAEIGYWIGKPYWNRGYCTEAARAMLRYGFEVLGLNRVVGMHISRNPASGRVMQKIGMRHEGMMRQHTKKWGQYDDLDFYGMLKSECAGSDE